MDQVSKHQNLHKRKGVWYYRRHVPLDVREAFGKSDIVKSLGTSSLREAKQEAHILNVQYDEEFEKKRGGGAPTDESSPHDRYSEVIEADFIYRSEIYEKAKKKPRAFFAGKIIDLPDDERFFHLTQENASLEEILAYVFKYDLKQRHRQLQIDLAAGNYDVGDSPKEARELIQAELRALSDLIARELPEACQRIPGTTQARLRNAVNSLRADLVAVNEEVSTADRTTVYTIEAPLAR